MPDAPPDAPVVDPVSDLLPAYLSETGLYTDITNDTVAATALPYAPRWELYSDGATKRRWLALPVNDTQELIPFDTTDMDHWVAPVGTKVWKEFSSGGVRVETRYFVKGAEGWEGVAYIWNEDNTEAVVAPDGKVDARGTTHNVPDMATCTQCHDRATDSLIGVSALQLDTDDVGDNETLATLIAAGAISAPPAGSAPYFPVGGTTDEVAMLGYFHANCGTCHNATSDLNYMPVEFRLLTNAIATPAQTRTYITAIDQEATAMLCDGNPVTCATLIVASGDPQASVAYRRFVSTNPARHMPQVGSEVTDEAGRVMLHAWITSLAP